MSSAAILGASPLRPARARLRRDFPQHDAIRARGVRSQSPGYLGLGHEQPQREVPTRGQPLLCRRTYLLQHDDGRRHEALGLERRGVVAIAPRRERRADLGDGDGGESRGERRGVASKLEPVREDPDELDGGARREQLAKRDDQRDVRASQPGGPAHLRVANRGGD